MVSTALAGVGRRSARPHHYGGDLSGQLQQGGGANGDELASEAGEASCGVGLERSAPA